MARINPRAKIVPSENEFVVSNEESSPSLNAFSKALSSALDESSERRIRSSRPRKNKSWKYQKPKSVRVKLGNCVSKSELKPSSKSDSDSSLDNWIDNQMDVNRKVISHCTDSDEVTKSHSSFSKWRPFFNIGESDSVTESAHRFRVPRRRRKIKHMSVCSPINYAFLAMARDDKFLYENEQNNKPRLQKNSKVRVKSNNTSKLPCAQISSKIKDVCPNAPREGSAYGKRKREEKKLEEALYDTPCTHHRGSPDYTSWDPTEFVGLFDNPENFPDLGPPSRQIPSRLIDIKAIAEAVQLSRQKKCDRYDSKECSGIVSPSRHSNSESECELSTNDESREADDEQSDFFCETGASGVLKTEDEYDEDECDEDVDDEDVDSDDERYLRLMQKEMKGRIHDPEVDGFCHLLRLKFVDIPIPAFRRMYQSNRQKLYEKFKKKIEEKGVNVEANQKKLLKAYRSFSYLTEEDLFLDMLCEFNISEALK